MTRNRIEMHIAHDKNSKKLMGIDKVEKGKKCDCICVSCRGELIAKQGEYNQWHFSHFHNSEKDCDYSFWVVCRDLAKQIFLSTEKPLKRIWISSKIGQVNVNYVSTEIAKMSQTNFDVSFFTKEYGRIYVYFVTPEHNRNFIPTGAVF